MEKLLAFLIVIGLLLLLAVILALPIMWLWNFCLVPAMPTILVKIGFWQALGIKVLIGLLGYSSLSSNDKK
jgi:hypothetical protein